MTIEQATHRARTESRNGYVQHVNRRGNEYFVSDWSDGSTVASYENGKAIGSIGAMEQCRTCGADERSGCYCGLSFDRNT